MGRKRFIFTRGFASKCFKAHKKRQLPGKLSAFKITAITTALHDKQKRQKEKKVICIKRGKKPSDQGAVGYGFASDWSKAWCEFSGPITKRNEAKPL